jgi:hypothetical protein
MNGAYHVVTLLAIILALGLGHCAYLAGVRKPGEPPRHF